MYIELPDINAALEGVKKVYRSTGSFGHLMLHYAFWPFVLHLASILLNVLVWDALPVLSLLEAILYMTVVHVSDTQYLIKRLARKGTNNDHRTRKAGN